MAPSLVSIRKSRNRRKVSHTKDWTFEDLVRYFGGNRTDAASQVCDKTIRYCLSSPNRSKYPLTPLNSPCTSPPGAATPTRIRSRSDPPTPYRESRLRSETDPNLLDFSALSSKLRAMTLRCNKCHRYMEGAPDPSLGHEGSAGDARCLLDHVPDPCEYVDKRGKKCTEYGEYDPDWVPGGTKTKEQLAKPKDDGGKSDPAVKDLAAKYDKMEANHVQVQGSVDKLTSDMEKLIKMMATLTKNDPNPAASLADNVSPPPPQLAPLQAVSTLGAAVPPMGAAGPPLVAGGHSLGAASPCCRVRRIGRWPIWNPWGPLGWGQGRPYLEV